MNQDTDTDTDTDTEFETTISDSIELFKNFYYDIILDFYYDFKNRVPYFLDKMSFDDLLSLIVCVKFKQPLNFYDINHDILYFKNDYIDEINGLFDVMNTFIRTCNKKIKFSCKTGINLKDWDRFSYEFTSQYSK